MTPPHGNVAFGLVERATIHPHRPAIIEGMGRRRRVISFRGLADRVSRLAVGLSKAGLGPGEKALLFVPMSIDLYTAILAVLHAGAQAVFLDAWASRARLAQAIALVSPKAFIGSPRAHLLRLLSPHIRQIPLKIMAGNGPLSLDRFTERSGSAPFPSDPASHALVTFTTGSTGTPKATPRSHGFLWAQHRVLARHLGLTDSDIDLPTLPVFVFNNLAQGVPSVLPAFDPRRPADIRADLILEQMFQEGVTTTCGSPAFFQRLADHAERVGRQIPVRRLFTGGASVFPPLASQLARWTAGSVEIMYGSSEAEPISTVPAEELVSASLSPEADGILAGRPVPEIQVELIRPDPDPVRLDATPWESLRVPPGQVGEIVVAGDHVLRGYLNAPEDDARNKIRAGECVWHRTGDAGRFDSSGCLWLMGRISHGVRKEGRIWWNTAAEARALGVPGVTHASFIGIPGPHGTRATLCLEAKPGYDREKLRREVKDAMDPIPVDEIRVMSRIPRDPRHQSKVDTVRLLELLRRLR
jgi:acyl-CoA synthetase (AMP-forming)/AMP-acid ligase II